jgi:hypothetical protein
VKAPSHLYHSHPSASLRRVGTAAAVLVGVGGVCVITGLTEEKIGTVAAGLAALLAGVFLEVLCDGIERRADSVAVSPLASR